MEIFIEVKLAKIITEIKNLSGSCRILQDSKGRDDTGLIIQIGQWIIGEGVYHYPWNNEFKIDIFVEYYNRMDEFEKYKDYIHLYRGFPEASHGWNNEEEEEESWNYWENLKDFLIPKILSTVGVPHENRSNSEAIDILISKNLFK